MIKKILYFVLASSICFGDSTFLGQNEQISLSPQNKETKKVSFDFSFLTDLCWSCFLPIHVAGYNWSSQKDFIKYKKRTGWDIFCICSTSKLWGFIPLPDQIGIPIAFWEPQAIIEVTRVPHRSLTLLKSPGNVDSYKNMGSVSNSDAGRSSFYNVHYYTFPLARIAMMIPGFKCLRNAELSMVVFRTEWFPFWNDMDHSLHSVLDPVRYLYRSPELQELCRRDCEAAMKRKPSNAYPWCAGCLGSLYPFTGHVSYHIGGIQASSLLVCRTIGLLHSVGLFLGGNTSWNVLGLGKGFEPDNYCEKTYSYNLKKTIYKTQMIYPKADKGQKKDGVATYCHPLGESDRDWGEGHTWAEDGEDFAYVVWTKMHCCLDATEPFKAALDFMKKIFGQDAKPDKAKEEALEAKQKEFDGMMEQAKKILNEKIKDS